MPPEFSIRSDAVDVEQVMKQIRSRIREKRGVDYTEDEIRELANVKLEKFLDPTRVRSDLLEHYREGRSANLSVAVPLAPAPANYAFEDHLVYGSARGAAGRLIAGIRTLLNPLLKLFINPNPMIQVLHQQGEINAHNAAQFERLDTREHARADLDLLNYEVIHNLVVEMTRLGIEVKNLKMRVESLSSRLDFNERRARALETVVQYRPGTGPAAEAARPVAASAAPSPARAAEPPRGGADDGSGVIKGEAQRNRRRRRRRGGRSGTGGPQGGQPPADGEAPSHTAGSGAQEASAAAPHAPADVERPASPEPPAAMPGPDSTGQ